MTFSIDVTHPSGIPWQIIPRTAEVGEQCVVVEAPVEFGDIVAWAVETDEYDETIIGGIEAQPRRVQIIDAGLVSAADANFFQHGFFGVVQHDEGTVAVGQKAPVQFGPVTCLCKVYSAGADTLNPGTPLVVADSGTGLGALELPAASTATGDVNTKVVGKVAQQAVFAGEGVQLVWVHFSGFYGWGSINTAGTT